MKLLKTSQFLTVLHKGYSYQLFWIHRLGAFILSFYVLPLSMKEWRNYTGSFTHKILVHFNINRFLFILYDIQDKGSENNFMKRSNIDLNSPVCSFSFQDEQNFQDLLQSKGEYFKPKEGRFRLGIREKFFTESGQALARAAQRDCSCPIHGGDEG